VNWAAAVDKVEEFIGLLRREAQLRPFEALKVNFFGVNSPTCVPGSGGTSDRFLGLNYRPVQFGCSAQWSACIVPS
jgi:hypothetical protein